MAKKKQQKTLNVSFLLDMTGSMKSVEGATISGFNEYIGSLKARNADIRFTLTLFNTDTINTVYKGVPIGDVRALDAKIYQPDSTTPLYDAIGRTIHETQTSLNDAKQDVLFVIMTDGHENASHEYSQQKVFELVKSKEKDGWTFAFLGANMDSWQVGQSIGVATPDSAMNYNQAEPKEAFVAFAGATLDYMQDPNEAKSRGVFHRVKNQ